jgi:hypothetical protein
MIIGHLPAGYIVARLLAPRAASRGLPAAPFVRAGIAGAVAPDLDMIYFHLVDHRRHHHHAYPTHFPIVWATLLLAALAWAYSGRRKNAAYGAVMFSLNGFIHLMLDTIVGDIWWLAPFVDRPFSLFAVAAWSSPWWLNFVCHWSFGFEVALAIWALALWRYGEPIAAMSAAR